MSDRDKLWVYLFTIDENYKTDITLQNFLVFLRENQKKPKISINFLLLRQRKDNYNIIAIHK